MQEKTGTGFAVLNALPISDRLVEAVKEFEGFRPVAEPDRISSYDVWTIGYGETLNVREGETTTPEAAEKNLRARLTFFCRKIQMMVQVSLSQGQCDALTDFAYNLGAERLRDSTLLRLLNAGEYEAAAHEFDRWVYAGGKRQPGLVTRRTVEKSWFTEVL